MARFLHPEDAHKELTLQDVCLIPQLWDGGSRRDVDISPRDFPGGSHPLVAANMNAVTGARLCEVLARSGGFGVLPQDIPPDKLKRIIGRVKAAHVAYDTALTIAPTAPINDARAIIFKRAAKLVVVVEGGKPVGVVAPDDLKDKDSFMPVGKIMTALPIVLELGLSPEEAFERLKRGNIRAAPVVDQSGKLIGTTSLHDIALQQLTSPALDSDGRLMVGVAIGVNGDPGARAREALSFGADLIVLDTAHAYQRKMLEAITVVRAEVGPSVTIVAGNVCTAEATEALLNAGASGVKVNVGPGAMCTTRMVTGVGRPTFSAVKDCAEAARALGKFAWADGGVKDPRDLAVYLAAGASRVMAGTLFAGTYESAEDVQVDADGKRFKSNHGMASARAVRDRNGGASALEQAVRGLFEEGISTSQVYLREGRESVGQIAAEFVTGLMSSCTYNGAHHLDELYEKSVVGVQTAAGFQEGTPHGKVRR